MSIAGIHDGTISGNSISLNVKNGTKHTDGIQFYRRRHEQCHDPEQPDRDPQPMSHGIYGGNGSNSSFYNNITIDHNTVVSGQVSGIAVGETNGLKITNNIVLQDASGARARR